MNLGLADKPVLVLASSGGLGRGVAMEFAREGARVMLFGRSEERLAAAASAIEAETGHRPLWTEGDLRSAEDIERAVDGTVSAYGGLWALFTNTGGPPAGNFAAFSDDAWQEAFALILLSCVRAVRAAVPHLRRSGGRIVNNASISTKQAIDGLLLSNVFRSGLAGLGKSLARELGRDRILVNTVGAGRIETDRIAQLDAFHATLEGITPAAVRGRAEASIPLGRSGQPADFARMVVFLCSEANSYLTGQNLLIDGGMVSAY
jgi:3-oxoacyl-[acyl-carrier protein] reductase